MTLAKSATQRIAMNADTLAKKLIDRIPLTDEEIRKIIQALHTAEMYEQIRKSRWRDD